VVRPFSEISLMGYNKVIKGFPNITLFVNGTPIVDENGLQIQDAVNALVFAITKHFVGDPADYRESAYDSLENLKCYTLSDFRWYKDVKKYAKLELGNFCEQFGYSPLKTVAPSRQRRKQQKLYKNNYKNYKSNKRNKPYKFYNNKPYKNFNFKTQAKNVGKQKDRTPVCYRCGKTGHFQKNCKVKKEINKIDISKYNTEQLKDKFLQILQTDSENESFFISSLKLAFFMGEATSW
jgi:hypothetical protein